jgi:hypothetical protein
MCGINIIWLRVKLKKQRIREQGELMDTAKLEGLTYTVYVIRQVHRQSTTFNKMQAINC